LLPLDLLRVHISKGRIHPVYADINNQNVELSRSLLKLFQTGLGKTKGDLLAEVASFENKGFDYRLVRGLSTVLERLSTFQVRAPVDPLAARRAIFQESARKDAVTTSGTREQILSRVAQELNVTAEELEQSFYADLEDELILESFNPPTDVELLKRYNLSLTQTLCFRSTYMEIKVSDHWKEILRAVKFRGLMYSAESANDIFRITVDGPLSLFKLTQRYGTSMAKVLPSIFQAKYWEINGSVIRKTQFGRRIFQLRLTSAQIGDKIAGPPVKKRRDIAFDSFVEEEFYNNFKSLKSGWKITREPPPLIVGRHVLIPDFSFERRGTKVYMEIAGFWTQKYLEKKIEKLQQLSGVNIIVAANQQLACDKLAQLEGEIFFYKKKVPLRPVLDFLNAREETGLDNEMRKLDTMHLQFDKDVVEIRNIAKGYEVSREAIRKKLETIRVEGYTLAGDLLVSDKKLQEIELKLETLSTTSLSAALELIEDEGIPNPYDVLSTLNFGIRWNGLDSRKSSIYKRQK
jgi:predicted nuclease of restriction endonuclease-like RecB superfamily